MKTGVRYPTYAQLEAGLPKIESAPAERGVVAMLAQSRDRWPLAGDQLYVDFDLSAARVQPGTRIAVGNAEIEVSPEPHMGCRLFSERYGLDARRFVNSAVGRSLNLRGINAWVVTSGEVCVGDAVRVAAG